MSKKSNQAPRDAEIFANFGKQSGIGKTTNSKLMSDLLNTTGCLWEGVSVDRSERLPYRYPGKFATVQLPTDRDGRLDPYARTRAFGPLDSKIERLIDTGTGKLVLDVGSGEYPGAVLEHASRSRMSSLLARAGVAFTAFVVTTADAAVMSDVPHLVGAILDALPEARVKIVLNEKNGIFRFSEGSEARKVWLRDVEPLLSTYPSLTIPAMPGGTWDPFEDKCLTFAEVGLLDPENNIGDEKKLIGWTREPRSLAIARQGDVAEFLHGAWKGLSTVMQSNTKGGDHAG
jgi:hypothetical protein